MCCYGTHHPLPPPIVPDSQRYFCALTIVSIKWDTEILEILLPMCGCIQPYLIEQSDRHTFGIRFRLHHYGGDRTDQHGFGYTTLSVFCSIPDHFATAGGVTN